MKNKYYKGNLPNSEMAKIYDIIVGLPSQQFTYDNGKKIVVKLPLWDEGNHPVLNSMTEISHEEAMVLTTDESQLQ